MIGNDAHKPAAFMTPAIETRALTKLYRTSRGEAALRAVDGIDFTVRPGEVFGFLGPNGAGKSTTIRMLTGLAKPTSGSAHVLGLDLARETPRIKKRIGVVPETSNLYDELTARDNLVFSMALYGVPRLQRAPRALALLERFRLAEKRDARFNQLSRGMKRAVTIAAALAHKPQLVFLDEPTLGLDVASARNLRTLIAGLRDEGVTVFLTTHYMEEAEQLCDRVAILVRGRIVALDSVDGLRRRAGGGRGIEVTVADAAGHRQHWRLNDDTDAALRAAIARADAQRLRIVAVETRRLSFEDVFVQLTGLGAETLHHEKVEREARDVGG